MREILRRLWRSPGFTAVALVTLAVAIGANAGIFGVINAVLLKPLPYRESKQLVSVSLAAPGLNMGADNMNLSPSTYFTFHDYSQTLQDIGLYTQDSVSLTGVSQPEQVPAMDVTNGTLRLLDVKPALGRVFLAKDDSPAAPKTALLSYGFWQHKFGGNPSVVATSLRIDGELRRVVGVLPQDFRFLDQTPSIYLPLQFDRAKVQLGNFSYDGIARLKPGVDLQRASADIARMIPIYLRSFPPPPGTTVQTFEHARFQPRVAPLAKTVVGDIGELLWVILGTVGLVLLIAAANVGNLLLVRSEARQREFAIRVAIGATRAQIASDILAESIVLALLGGLCGLILAGAALEWLVRVAPPNLPRLSEIGVDWRITLFTVGISVAAGVLFGAIPALKFSGLRFGAGLRAGDRNSTASRQRNRARNLLVVAQVALGVVLLVSSGLMLRTVSALAQVAPGFRNPETLQTFQIDIAQAEIKGSDDVTRTENRIVDAIRALPGVSGAAFASRTPMDGMGSFDPVFARDKSYNASDIPLQPYIYVSPGFFELMGVSLAAGRDYTWSDLYDHRNVAIVSEGLAKKYWGSAGNAVGKMITDFPGDPWREVIGVASDVHWDGLNQPPILPAYWPVLMQKFEAQADIATRTPKFVVRTNRAGSQAFIEELRRAIWSVNPSLPIAEVRTSESYVQRSMIRTSFALVTLSAAAGMALILGVVGLYGVIAYSVAQRRREIGVRVAVGAQPNQVLAVFLRTGLGLTAIGLAIGVVAALSVMRILSSLLYGVKANDALTYAGACGALLIAATIASLLPSLRALRVNPVEALRAE